MAPHRTGVGETVFELAARLPWVAREHSFLYFFSSLRQPLPRFPLMGQRVDTAHWRLPGPLLLSLWLGGKRPRAEDLARRAQLYHAPAMFAPPSEGLPVILTIHDLFFLERPDLADGAPWGDVYLRKTLPLRMAEAAMILCPSHLTADQVEHHFGEVGAVERGRLRIIPWGVGARSFVRARASDLRVLESLGVARPYLLAVGTSSRRKNIEGLLKAYEMVGRSKSPTPPLVVVGSLPNGVRAPRGEVIPLPYLRRRDLGIVIRNASLFICASWMEGFGLPLLQAMAAGVPVVATPRVGVLDFTGSNSVAMADSPDAESLAEKILQVLKDDALRAQLAKAGRQAAAALTWRRTAEETVNAYDEAIRT